MKSIIYITSLVLVNVLFCGCSSEQYEDYSADQKATADVLTKIRRMAEDYGVSVEVSGNLPSSMKHKINWDEIEKLISAYANMPSSSQFSVEPCGESHRRLIPMKKTNRKRRISNSNESAGINRGYWTNFINDTPLQHGYDDLFWGEYSVHCTCTAEWNINEQTGYATSILITPNIEYTGVYNFFTIDVIPKTPIITARGSDGSFTFNGKVDVVLERFFSVNDEEEEFMYMVDEAEYGMTNYSQWGDDIYYYLTIILQIDYSGSVSDNKGYISWSKQERLY